MNKVYIVWQKREGLDNYGRKTCDEKLMHIFDSEDKAIEFICRQIRGDCVAVKSIESEDDEYVYYDDLDRFWKVTWDYPSVSWNNENNMISYSYEFYYVD